MKVEEKLICNYMADFFNRNFSKIKYDLADSNLPTQKDRFVDLLRKNPQDAIWSLDELANWGMDKTYLKELYVELLDDSSFRVLKIDDKYIKVTYDDEYIYHFDLTEPKKKTVIYFE